VRSEQPEYIEIDGKHYLWRDVLQLCREQLKAFARPNNRRCLD